MREFWCYDCIQVMGHRLWVKSHRSPKTPSRQGWGFMLPGELWQEFQSPKRSTQIAEQPCGRLRGPSRLGPSPALATFLARSAVADALLDRRTSLSRLFRPNWLMNSLFRCRMLFRLSISNTSRRWSRVAMPFQRIVNLTSLSCFWEETCTLRSSVRWMERQKPSLMRKPVKSLRRRR